MEMTVIQKAIADYGYWALFAGTFLEGETFFLLGGVAAHQGLLNPWGVAAAAMAGGFLGDQIFFLLGRWRGVELLARSRRLVRKAVVARRLVRRHAVPLMLLSRFLYGLRMIVPLVCGVARIHPLVFMALNLVSALSWALVFGGLGYLFSGWVLAHLDSLRGLAALAGLVLVVLLGAAILGRWLQRRLLQKVQNE
jgi:membrane protein DedA with SNARE-associated domain